MTVTSDFSWKNGDLLTLGAGLSLLVIVAVVAAVSLPGSTCGGAWSSGLFLIAYFTLTLLHTGVRVVGKTYLFEMAQRDRRTTHVVVAKSVMGFVLLFLGALSSAVVVLEIRLALLRLAGGAFALAEL